MHQQSSMYGNSHTPQTLEQSPEIDIGSHRPQVGADHSTILLSHRNWHLLRPLSYTAMWRSLSRTV